MWLLMAALVLTALRYLEWGPFATLSWWWVAAAYAAAFVWFEWLEALFGFERKRAFNEMEAARKARIERALQRDPIRKRR
jgi:small Trp-rich protein